MCRPPASEPFTSAATAEEYRKECDQNDRSDDDLSGDSVRLYGASFRIDLLFFGKNATYANNITDNMVVVPRVRLDRETNKAVTILGFEIIAPTGDSEE